MGTLINVNKYRMVADGGKKIDKRTWQHKELISRINRFERTCALNPDIPHQIMMLRIKDIDLIFTTENLILN